MVRISSRSPSSVRSETSAAASAAGLEVEIGEGRLALPQDAADARMRVLNVEDRVILALLDHLGEVEVERRVVLAHQHDEADGVRANLIHDFAKSHEVPRPL